MGTLLLDIFSPEHGAKQHLIAVLWWTECTKRPMTLILELDIVCWTFYIVRRYKVVFFWKGYIVRKALLRVGNNAKDMLFNQVF